MDEWLNLTVTLPVASWAGPSRLGRHSGGAPSMAMTGASRAVDPITLASVWNGLIAAAEEVGIAIRSTAFTEAIREGDDFSVGIFDTAGRMVAQGNFSPGPPRRDAVHDEAVPRGVAARALVARRRRHHQRPTHRHRPFSGLLHGRAGVRRRPARGVRRRDVPSHRRRRRRARLAAGRGHHRLLPGRPPRPAGAHVREGRAGARPSSASSPPTAANSTFSTTSRPSGTRSSTTVCRA